MGHVALGLLVTAPMLGTLGARLIGDGDVDVWNHAWGLWWFWDSLVHFVLPLKTTLLNAPQGGRLWFIDPIGALIGMGLVPIFGLVTAWNLTILTLVVCASVAGRRLAQVLGAGPQASWIGAIGVAASPHVISEIHNGISEAVGVAWAVFALAALFRALEAPSERRRWIVLGLLGGLTVLGTYYYALGLAAAAAPVVAVALWRGPRRPVLVGSLLAALPAAAIAVPVLLVVHSTVAEATSAIIPRQEGAWQERFWALQHNAVDPLSFFLPGDFQSVDLASLGEAFRHTSYLGWFVLIPALVSARRARLGYAVLPLVLSLGPFLWVWGGWVELGGNLVALPYRVLLEVLPAGAIAHPQRIGFVGMALVAGLGAAAVAERHARWLAAALLVELLLLSPAPWPVERAPALDLAYARAIQAAAVDRPFAGTQPAVLDVPAEQAGHGMSTSRYLVAQTVHGRPIPFGPNVRKDGFTLYRNRLGAALIFARPGELAKVASSDLARGDIGWVVLHRDLGDTTEAEAWLCEKVGKPEEYGDALLWDIRPKGAAASPGQGGSTGAPSAPSVPKPGPNPVNPAGSPPGAVGPAHPSVPAIPTRHNGGAVRTPTGPAVPAPAPAQGSGGKR